jgi:hypothetical protein
MKRRTAGLLLSAAILASACSAGVGAARRTVDDTSYDQIEALRAARVQAQAADTSYDLIEQLRGRQGLAPQSDSNSAPHRKVPPKGLR